MPKLGLVISFHISAAIAGAVISGSSSMIETALWKRVGRRSSSAIAKPEQELEHDGQGGVGQRERSVFQNAGSERKSM